MHLHASNFPYDIIKNRYGDKSHLLSADTDSFESGIETPDIYKDMIGMKEHFILSNFDSTKPYRQTEFGANKAVRGKMNNEASGNLIREFVGLRPRMYSFKMVC